jgi:hypothetical protein
MTLRPRFRVRTMMAIIARIALGFGISFELKNHAERDRLLKRMAGCYREAAIHFMRAWECDGAEKVNKPYSSAERTKLWTVPNRHRPSVGHHIRAVSFQSSGELSSGRRYRLRRSEPPDRAPPGGS